MSKGSNCLDTEIDKYIEKAWKCIQKEELVQLTSDLVNISSPTGEEAECAGLLVKFMKDCRMDAFCQPIEEGRANAVGIIRGTGEGPTLLFNGHMDTSFTGRQEEDYAALGPLHPDSLPRARYDGERIYGLGAYNMKGGLAATVIAAKAIAEAAVPLKGSIFVTGVAGEIEKCPLEGAIKSYQGKLYMGASLGTEWLIRHGIIGDFVINGEPTDLRVNWENGGYVWLKVQTRGKATYVIRKPYGVNAILQMMKVIEAVEQWAPRYTEAHKSELTVPQVMVGSIESGWPYKPSTCPAICNAYVDVRLAPGQDPLEAVREFDEVIRHLKTKDEGLEVQWQPYLLAKGQRTDPENPYVQSCIKAYEKVMSQPHERCTSEQASAWTDCNIFRTYGIPAVSLGPGAGTPPKEAGVEMQFAGGEHQKVEDLLTAARIYVAAALDICLRPQAGS